MNVKQPSLLGGALIIAGTVIGAGMFANPTATAGVWFFGSLLVLLYTWFSMLSSGLMILEVNTHYPPHASFDTLVKDLLGSGWNIINGLAVAFVLYLLTYAYIFVGGNTMTMALNLPNLMMGQLLFFFIFAVCVWWSAKAVDRFSSVLIGGMVLTFFMATGGLITSVKWDFLTDAVAPEHSNYWIYAGTALPVCLASFGFHGNVSSLFKYFQGNAKKVAQSLWVGTLIALVIYVLWQMVIHGNLPRHAFQPIIQADGDIGVLIQTLSQFMNTGNMAFILSIFAYMAVASSFLGVTLGLFDYLADLFGFDDSRLGRTKTAGVTFLPPLICCLLFPLGFVQVIAYVGMVATIWTAIVPALLLYACRKKYGVSQHYRVYGGVWLMVWVFLFGIINMVSPFLVKKGILPTFMG